MTTVPNVAMINLHARPRNPVPVAGFWETIRLWSARSSQRRALAMLDERTLLDIGVSRATALNEADKPFWRP